MILVQVTDLAGNNQACQLAIQLQENTSSPVPIQYSTTNSTVVFVIVIVCLIVAIIVSVGIIFYMRCHQRVVDLEVRPSSEVTAE